MKRLLTLCLFAYFTMVSSLYGQGTSHGRINANGKSTFDAFTNTATVAIVGATPSVALGNVFRTANGGSTTITNFLGGTDTQKITVICGDIFTTIQNNSNIVTSAGADYPCSSTTPPSEFVYSGPDAKWYQVSGGGGGSGSAPGGVNGDNQIKNGSLFAAGHQNDDGTRVYTSLDSMFKGPNPYPDIRAYGARFVTVNAAPAVPGVTANCTNLSTTVAVSNSLFINGDGITIWGCGAVTSLSTPAAPTVTPSNITGPMNTGMVISSPACATAFQYQIAAVHRDGGYTPAGAAGTTATGCTLGAQSRNISTLTKVNNVVTGVTSSAHNLAVGARISIQNTTDSANFGGSYTVATVADNTHFTYITPTDTRSGGTASVTGGTVKWIQSNHVTWSPVSGAYYYIIFGNTSGSMARVGLSKPQDVANSITDPSFDDFGSTLTGTPTMLAYFPTTPPVSGANNNLTTVVVSGGGSPTLVVANAAGATLNGVTAVIDAGPAMVASGGNFTIPFAPSATTGLVVYSYVAPTSTNVMQHGPLYIYSTIQLATNAKWYGNVIPVSCNPTSFANVCGAQIQIQTSAPGLFQPGSSATLDWGGLNIQGANNGLFVVLDGISGLEGNKISFTPNGGSEVSTMALLIRNSQFELKLHQITMNASQSGDSTTPLFFCNRCDTLRMDIVNFSGRGMFFNGVGLTVVGGRKQGGTDSAFILAPLSGAAAVGGAADTPYTADTRIVDYELDTDPNPLVVNAQPSNTNTGLHGVVIEHGAPWPAADTGGALPTTSGPPFPYVKTEGAIQSQSNSSIALGISSTYGSDANGHPTYGISSASGPLSQANINLNINLGAKNGLTLPYSVPAPTATLTTSGCTNILAAGTYKYMLSVVGVSGVESTTGLPSNSVTANGTTQCVALAWTDVASVKGYKAYVNINGSGYGQIQQGTCASGSGTLIAANSCTDIHTFFGSAPPGLNGTGNPELYPGLVGTNVIKFGSIAGGNYGVASISGNFTANRTMTLPDAAGTFGLLSGAFSNNDCLKANVSGGVSTIVTLGLGCALTSSGLNQFASTTSAQLAGVISDETGSGLAVFNNAPALTSPTVSTTLVMAASAELRFLNGANYVGFKAPASLGSNLVFALPQTDSTGTQCLSSNGSLSLAWSACSAGTGTPGGSPTNVQYNNTTFAGSPAFTFNGTDTVGIGTNATTLGKLKLFGNTSGSVTIQSLAVAGTPTLTLPNTTGTFAVGASSPLALDSSTGNLTCATCTTNVSGLTANAIVLGAGSNAVGVVASLGTTTTVLHGNVAGAPTFGAVVLTTDVSGALPFANGGTGQTTQQAAINALLPGANGDVFFRNGSGNVVSLAAVSAGSCLLSGAVPAWGSCSSGSITGSGAAGQLTVWNTSSSLTSSANFTYSAGILNENQSANGLDTFTGKRFTDSAPTGTFIKFLNAAGSSTLFQVDVTGAVNAASFNASSTVAGFTGLGQGTAQGIVANVVGLTAPTSVTGYNLVFPSAAGTGVLRGSNSAGIVSLSFVSASGVGSCTNQVVTAVNDNAIPSCNPVVGPMFGTQAANLVFKGPNSGVPAFPTFAALVSADIPPINLNTNGANGGVTAILPYINGGCNASSASACFNGITPMTTTGDIEFEQSAGVAARLAAGTSTQVLHSGSAPSWSAVSLTADVTGTLPIANGGTNATSANSALNNLLPSQGGNAGTCLGTNATNASWVSCGSAGSTVTPHPNFGASFSGVTTTTITGASHLMGTKNLVVACYDNSSPAKAIFPASWTVNSSTFDVVVNFAVSATGYCVVNGSGPNRYASSFSSVTSVTISGATHLLATADLEVTVWDNSSPRKKIIPASVTVDTSSFDVVITFATSQSGRIVLQ